MQSVIFYSLFLFLMFNTVTLIQGSEAGHNEFCDNVYFTCNTTGFMVCDEEAKLCKCKDPEKSEYNEENKVCWLKNNEPCSIEKGAMGCNEVSLCKNSGDVSGQYRCQCDQVFCTESPSKDKCVYPYGADCLLGPNDYLCDTSSFMKCNEGKCTCANEDSWYDIKTMSCVNLEGKPCVPGEGQQKCGDGAECDEVAKTCVCQNGVIPVDGKCVMHYGGSCDTTKPLQAQCNGNDFLTCKSGKCQCQDENMAYDSKTGKCNILVGSICHLTGPSCVPGAYCPQDGDSCTCVPGLTKNKNNQCFLEYGKPCEEREIPNGWFCDESKYLYCDIGSSTCQCSTTDDSIFEEGVCKKKANKLCVPNSDKAQKCLKNAKCVGKGSSGFCACEEPLESNSADTLCVLKFNASCDTGFKGECDAAKFHECSKEKRCECKSPSEHHSFPSKCTLKMGLPCTEGKNQIPCDDTLACISGNCGCDEKEGLGDNGFGKCKKLHGTECNPDHGANGLCDADDNFLTCSGGKCICDQQHNVDANGKPCVGNLNAKCRTDANCNQDNDLKCDVVTGKCKESRSGKLDCNFGLILIAIILADGLKFSIY